MNIPTKRKDVVVSILKKNNKLSLGLMKIEENGEKRMLKGDSLFPFNVPLITDSAVRTFEFIIEANNFAERFEKDI